jgi:hypothetical protein
MMDIKHDNSDVIAEIKTAIIYLKYSLNIKNIVVLPAALFIPDDIFIYLRSYSQLVTPVFEKS